MPAFLGPVQIYNVGGGTVQFGDAAIISPKSTIKETSGSGSSSTGAFIGIFNGLSSNATVDSSLIDQPAIGNN